MRISENISYFWEARKDIISYPLQTEFAKGVLKFEEWRSFSL